LQELNENIRTEVGDISKQMFKHSLCRKMFSDDARHSQESKVGTWLNSSIKSNCRGNNGFTLVVDGGFVCDKTV
jgi:hypothetical protein